MCRHEAIRKIFARLIGPGEGVGSISWSNTELEVAPTRLTILYPPESVPPLSSGRPGLLLRKFISLRSDRPLCGWSPSGRSEPVFSYLCQAGLESARLAGRFRDEGSAGQQDRAAGPPV